MPNFLFEGLLGPLFIAALLLTALLKILKITEKMSGDFGAMAAEYAGKVVGVAGTAAIGVATGGASVAMRTGMGAIAQGLSKEGGMLKGLATSERAGALGAVGRWSGRQALTLTDKAQKGTWDVRETGFGKATLGKGMKAVGMDMGSKTWKSEKGGYKGAQERRDKKDYEGAERLEMSKEGEAKMTEVERTAHEDASRVADELKVLVDEVKQQAKDAEKDALASDEGQALKGATANVSAQKASLEKLKQSTTADPEMIRQAERELVGAEGVLARAQSEYEKPGSKGAKFKEAERKAGEKEGEFTAAQEAAAKKAEEYEEAKKVAKRKVDDINKRRREQYARGTAAGGGAAYYFTKKGKEANEERVRKIRKGRSEGERKAKKGKDKTLEDLFKEWSKEQKEAGGEGTEAKKEEGGKH